MRAGEFIEMARDPGSWYSKAIGLKSVADHLWRESEAKLERMKEVPPKSDRGVFSQIGFFLAARSFYSASLMLYGNAIEAALKGRILEWKPKEFLVDVKIDGKGEFRSAEITGKNWKTHNLIPLAKEAGILEDGKDNGELCALLKKLSEAVVWAVRYPVPIRSSEDIDLEEILGDWENTHEGIEDLCAKVLKEPEFFKEAAEYGKEKQKAREPEA